MKKLFALAAMVALLAPAIAVCAGTSSSMRAGHECCPPDEVVTATSASVADASCCDRSAEAGQRAAVITAGVAPFHFGAPIAMAPVAAHVMADTAGLLSAEAFTGPPADSPPSISPPLSLRI